MLLYGAEIWGCCKQTEAGAVKSSQDLPGVWAAASLIGPPVWNDDAASGSEDDENGGERLLEWLH